MLWCAWSKMGVPTLAHYKLAVSQKGINGINFFLMC